MDVLPDVLIKGEDVLLTGEFLLGLVFVSVAALLLGLLAGVLLWNHAQRRAAMKRGDV